MAVPVLEEIVRQHAEQAAFLWTVYDRALLYPDENPEMDEERIARVVERLDAHLDGLRVAGAEGLRIAEERYGEYPEAGELFVIRMLQPGAEGLRVAELELEKIRRYLGAKLQGWSGR
ncbi:hypothetical protein DEA8626_02251 [Defluviimonas aquaemixtae]|uniref:Uncharacterized protein n=1 Tax=Albidovulum aquaemixtae TaxID=1542388 RepID=A0A2R8B836_9RHOB|nr:hypothetical protein [Defluviimonas aquaemixtae]SPH18709.1 hypothetical protein DEA8626_02251 [Defluviimonas aquaemixtae]